MPSKPGRDDKMTGSLKLQFLDLSEACTYIPGESAIDNYAGHMVGRMPEPLEIGFRFTHTLEECRIAGLHIDVDATADDLDASTLEPVEESSRVGALS